ncbi:kinase-like domain-containing protein [Suillus paluster]|uniref:kinase-like domain-containing protein n=1 Tax=Suillus paluster TaxID=48578 RepID=UPI001B882D95|nr:kinase-like domain-containing protein [Suillus paluster]KAG1733016.1 kinase-like domain-containing protein [Suillus paluster]
MITEHFTSAIHPSSLPDDTEARLHSMMIDDELQTFQLSIGSKGVYAHWVTKYAVRSAQWVKAGIVALDIFVLAHPEIARLPGVLLSVLHLISSIEIRHFALKLYVHLDHEGMMITPRLIISFAESLVLKTASSIRDQPCTISEGDKFSGGCNIVNRIIFEDGTVWALRVPYDETPSPIEATVTTMRYVHSIIPSIPVATVHAWSDSKDGDGIGTPYILLDWIDGRTLEWNARFPPPAARGKVLAQLAQYTADLLARTLMHANAQSTLRWILRRIDPRLTRIFTGDLSAFDPIDCLIFRAMAEEKYFVPSLDTFPFPLMHTDLNQMNVLVDDDFNITGILDWDEWACRLPLQCAVMCPAMIAVGNDPLHDEIFREDRLVFTEHFTSAIHPSGLSDDIKARLPSLMIDDELQTFQLSIGSKGVYAHWVTKYAVRSVHWVNAAIVALDLFVLAHPEMASLSGVLSARVRLLEMQADECRL